jgi:hypothetical protein
MATGAPPMSEDAVNVSFVVAGIEPLQGAGALRAMANVEVNVGGTFDFTLQGIQVRARGNGLVVQAPQYRDPKSGRWLLPAVLLPPELRDAIAATVLEELGSCPVGTVLVEATL